MALAGESFEMAVVRDERRAESGDAVAFFHVRGADDVGEQQHGKTGLGSLHTSGLIANCGSRVNFKSPGRRKTVAATLRLGYTVDMKKTTIQQVPQQWAQILDWLACDEEVEVTRDDRIIARIVPAPTVPAPDFVARAQAVWGASPPGQSLSAIVNDSRE